MGNGSKKKRRDARQKTIVLGLILLALFYGWWHSHAARKSHEPVQWAPLVLTPQDRILILAPHPDDEVLGCAGIVQRAKQMNLPIRVVFLTYGDSNQWSFLLYRRHPVWSPKAVKRMGLIRHSESEAAAHRLGLSPENLVFLGYPDLGMMTIWNAHWAGRPPYRSLLTKVTTVPYENALRPGALYRGEEVLRDLESVLRAFRPTKIFVSHPADYHPDHRALYLFTQIALWDLQKEMRPAVYPYLIHFKRWPNPKRYRPDQFLSPPVPFISHVSWYSSLLSPEEIKQKRLALEEHKTQVASAEESLLAFVRPNELFGDFPVLTLTSPSSVLLSPDHAKEEPRTPEELTDAEQAAFVGLEERAIQLEKDELVLTITFSRPLAEAVEASIFFFGYRQDRPFSEMPKLHIRVGAITHDIYDQDKKLSQNALYVNRQLNKLVIHVPLDTLGNPQKVLTSAQTYLGEVPLDWASWRVLELI